MSREWTEQDEDKFRADRRSEKAAVIRRVMADAQKRLEKAEENYQSTGSASASRTVQKYEEIVMVCEMALESLEQECYRCALHRRNGAHITEELRKRAQTGSQMPIDEAISFIESVAY